MRSERERLLDIQEAIQRIEKYAARGRKSFESDELVQSWIVRHLEIIGEAVRSLSPEFKDQHKDVPWAAIVGMRNILVHSYFGIDVEAVWSAVERDIPGLKSKIERFLQAAKE